MEGQGWSGGSRVEGPGYNVKGGGSRLRVKEGGSRVEGVDFGGSIMKGQGPRVKVQGWRVKCVEGQGFIVKGGGSRVEGQGQGCASVLFKRTFRSLHSFPFF